MLHLINYVFQKPFNKIHDKQFTQSTHDKIRKKYSEYNNLGNVIQWMEMTDILNDWYTAWCTNDQYQWGLFSSFVVQTNIILILM